MTTRSDAVLHERRRLGSWLPNKEATLAAFRKNLAALAHEQSSKKPTAEVVRELAALVNGDPVLRMDFTRAIDEALAAGNELGYSSIDELMVLLDYLMTYAPQFSENAYSSSDKPHMELQVKDGKENPENLTGRAFTG